MDALDTRLITLKADDWFQTIANKSGFSEQGLTMTVNCIHLTEDPDELYLSTGEQLAAIPVGLTFIQGQLRRGNDQPLEHGIGLFSYSNTKGAKPPSTIGCYVGIDPEHFRQIWAQVAAMAFSECTISLQIGPLKAADPHWDITTNRHLFVLGVDVTFRKKVPL